MKTEPPWTCSSVGSSNQSVERAFQVRKGVVRSLSFAAHARSLLPRSGARTKLCSGARSPFFVRNSRCRCSSE